MFDQFDDPQEAFWETSQESALQEGRADNLIENLPLESSPDVQYSAESVKLWRLKQAIDQELLRRVDNPTPEWVIGTGVGAPERDFCPSPPGEPVLNVYVSEPGNSEQVRQYLTSDLELDGADDEAVAINVVHTGVVEAQSPYDLQSPLAGGGSISHPQFGQGVMGCLARGRNGRRRKRLLLLSNNHVLARGNQAELGDYILRSPTDRDLGPESLRVGVLEQFTPLHYSQRANLVDCATAWTWSDRVRPELLYLHHSQPAFFQISNRTCKPQRGMSVGKSGRSTQLTVGRILDISVSIVVRYGCGRRAFFRDQIAIRGVQGEFSQSGDSGAVVWTWNSKRNPVGLLFSGGEDISFANKIDRVLSALDISLYV